ncbi:hypothetical protein FKW77_008413 [Venturia effusa]|uniref:Uncharacterized protein n=1 Tax=Venturia effusa TaxID=50376 RepID=A0A517KX05_9PEZI|nr:hypothetical protein FKW77_008413 [Venturia effusa]
MDLSAPPHDLSHPPHETEPKPSSPVPPALQSPTTTQPLLVDFSWKNLQAKITAQDSPTVPLYIVDAPLALVSPRLTFRHENTGATFGTAKLHPISIHADVTLHDRPVVLRPLKRFKTSYTHLSAAYPSSPADGLVPMTWTTTVTAKRWDFICLDPSSVAVARFSARIWGVRRLGTVEFLGERGGVKEWREEVVVMAVSLLYLMIFRMNNPLNLVGAVFAKTGKGRAKKGE